AGGVPARPRREHGRPDAGGAVAAPEPDGAGHGGAVAAPPAEAFLGAGPDGARQRRPVGPRRRDPRNDDRERRPGRPPAAPAGLLALHGDAGRPRDRAERRGHRLRFAGRPGGAGVHPRLAAAAPGADGRARQADAPRNPGRVAGGRGAAVGHDVVALAGAGGGAGPALARRRRPLHGAVPLLAGREGSAVAQRSDLGAVAAAARGAEDAEALTRAGLIVLALPRCGITTGTRPV